MSARQAATIALAEASPAVNLRRAWIVGACAVRAGLVWRPMGVSSLLRWVTVLRGQYVKDSAWMRLSGTPALISAAVAVSVMPGGPHK